MKYNSYQNGLLIGDYVLYKEKNTFLNSYTKIKTCVILHRELLFCKNTQYGNRSFYIYKVLDSNNKIKIIKTQNIRIIKRSR